MLGPVAPQRAKTAGDKVVGFLLALRERMVTAVSFAPTEKRLLFPPGWSLSGIAAFRVF